MYNFDNRKVYHRTVLKQRVWSTYLICMPKKGVLPEYFDTECSLCGDMFTRQGLRYHQLRAHGTYKPKRREKVTSTLQINLKQELQSLNVQPGDTVLVQEKQGSISITHPEERYP